MALWYLRAVVNLVRHGAGPAGPNQRRRPRPLGQHRAERDAASGAFRSRSRSRSPAPTSSSTFLSFLPGRLALRSLLVVGLLALLVPTSVAPAQSIDEARDQREATRAEQARVAEELDALKADAATLAEVLSGLDQAIAYQEAKVDAATHALRTAEATVAAAEAEAASTGLRILAIKARVTEAALDSYTGGLARDTEQFLASKTATEASQRRELLDVVRRRYDDDLEELRSLKERQRRASERAALATAEAASVEFVLTAARLELDGQWATQAKLAAVLRGRIGNVEAEVERLESAESNFTAVINQHLAEQAAAEAAARNSAVKVTAAPSFSGASASGFIMPTHGGITSSFGYRLHPILGYSRLHAGIDIGASEGTPVWASKKGEVILAGWNGGYGNCVIIAHAGGFATLYAHMSELAVSEGQTVGQGEIIGWVGSTGASTGPHLHFEIWVGGEPNDPQLFL